MGLSHLLNVFSGAAVSTHPDILFDCEVKEYRLLAHHACAEKANFLQRGTDLVPPRLRRKAFFFNAALILSHHACAEKHFFLTRH